MVFNHQSPQGVEEWNKIMQDRYEKYLILLKQNGLELALLDGNDSDSSSFIDSQSDCCSDDLKEWIKLSNLMPSSDKEECYDKLVPLKKKVRSKSSKKLQKEAQNKDINYKPFECDYCEKLFLCKNYLAFHLQNHVQSRLLCWVCNGFCTFACKSYLKRHMWKRHNVTRFYECLTCHRKFEFWNKLNLHLKSHREQRQLHRCEICLKTFKFNHELRKHEKVHSASSFLYKKSKSNHVKKKSKSFRCAVCPVKFKFRKGIQAHERSHRELFPLACKICKHSYFKSLRALRIHQSRKHKKKRTTAVQVQTTLDVFFTRNSSRF